MKLQIQSMQKVMDVIKKVCFKNSLNLILLIPLIFISCKTMGVAYKGTMGSYEIVIKTK